MKIKHHCNISNYLKIKWCFCFLILFIFSCKSVKTDTNTVEKPTRKVEIIEFSNIKTDTFLQFNQAECKIKTPIIKNIEEEKTKIAYKNTIKKIAFEIPENMQKQTYDDGRLHDGFAIASLIVGILGIPFYGKILGPIAIVLGIIGLFRSGKHKSRTGRGYAIAGIILGICAIVASFFIVNK